MKEKITNYIIAIGLFVAVYSVSLYAKYILHILEINKEHGLLIVFFLTALVFVLSTIIYHTSRLTNIPSFVIAIFFGIGAKPFLEPIVTNNESLSVIVGLGATLILFSGGLETHFGSFKKLLGKILVLSFPGLLITAFLTSMTVFFGGKWLGFEVNIITAVLLGAVLASTDPAAIIPVLSKLKFRNKSIKDIIVSESAMTDVTGTLLTVVFLSLIAGQVNYDNIASWYNSIFSQTSALILFKQLFFGMLLGILGYLLLRGLTHIKKKNIYSYEADLPYFLFVPIMIFVLALVLEGSGYMAAFIAGLLFRINENLKETSNFFNSLIEGFFKPTIFILLGALVDITKLFEYGLIGITVALVFMFLIRPLIVFVSLSIFCYFGKERLCTNDMLFISFVRETGAIPAVLLVTIASLNLPETDGLLEIGMWVILATLIISPPLTPRVAKTLHIAKPQDEGEDPIDLPKSPAVMLVSRGYGFTKRLPTVIDYAVKHDIKKVLILLCLEQKYTKELEKSIKEVAHNEFRKANKVLEDEDKNELEFSFISREGLLKDNIDFISNQTENPITVLFAGRKILDYRLEEIKHLSMPVKFID